MGLRFPFLGTVEEIVNDISLPVGVNRDEAGNIEIEGEPAGQTITQAMGAVSDTVEQMTFPTIPNIFEGFGGRITLIVFGVATIAALAHVAGKAVK